MKKIEDILIKIAVWIIFILFIIATGRKVFVIQPIEKDFYTYGTAVHQLQLMRLKNEVQDE